MITKIVVALQVPGVHWWPEGPNAKHRYLQYPHRHTFHIKVTLCVTHADRQIEFLEYQSWLRSCLFKEWGEYQAGEDLLNFGTYSCEMIAQRLLSLLDAVEVEVLEDGECGAIVSK